MSRAAPLPSIIAAATDVYLLRLEPITLELQRPAVFRDNPHHLLRRSVGRIYADLQRHVDVRALQPSEMRNDFLGNPTSITASSHRVEGDAAVESMTPTLSINGCGLVP